MTVEVPIYRLTGREKEVVAIALVDDLDQELVAGREWHIGTGYPTSHNQLMHRLIAGARAGEVVHHRNGSKLDNRRENLEVWPSHSAHMREAHPEGTKNYRQR